MGLFDFLGSGQQSQTAQPAQQANSPADPNQNPWTQVYNAYNNPLARLLGGAVNAEGRAEAQAKAQAWQAGHDYSNGTGQFAPPQQGYGGALSVTDTTAASPGSVTGTDYTSSPGPMDQIAYGAQGGTQSTGGTSLLDTGPAPQVPPYDSLGLPKTRQQTAQDALRLAAAGADPNIAGGAYDWANPASRVDATPQYVTGTAGEVYRVENGQYTLVKNPDPRFVQYSDQAGLPHMGYVAQPIGDPVPPAAPPRVGQASGLQGAPTFAGSAAGTSPISSQFAPPPRIGAASGPASSQAPGAPPMYSPSSTANITSAAGASMNEKTQALQTAIAEDPQNPIGPLSVILNRAAATGQSINQILQAPGQFETVSNGRASRVPVTQASALYQDPQVQAAFNGQIPGQYAGATSFYSPSAQRALGRRRPAWDDGSGVDIGQSRYFRNGYGGVSSAALMSQGADGTSGGTPAPGQDSQQSGPPRIGGNSDQLSMSPGLPGFQPISIPTQSSQSGALDPMSENIAQSIAAGKMAPLTIGGRNSPRNAVIMSRVMDIDPNYDANVWAQRQDTTKNFFNGPAGKQLGSLNTAMEHLGSLANSVDAINNSDAPGYLNWAGNMLSNATAFGPQAQQRVGQYNSLDLNIKTAMQEALSAYKAAGGTEGEFNGMLKDFDVNGSRTSQYQVLAKVMGLLDGKRQQLLQQYQTGMGGDVPIPSQLIDPNADAVAARIDAGAAGLPPRKSSMATSAPAPAGFRILAVK